MWAGQVENIWEKAICASAKYKDSEYCPMKGPFCTATCQKTYWWDENENENKNSWWYGRASPISKGGCMKKAPATIDTPKRYPGVGIYKNPLEPSDVSCVCDTFEDGIKLKDVPKLSRTTGLPEEGAEYDGLGKAIKRCRTVHVGLSGRGEPGCVGNLTPTVRSCARATTSTAPTTPPSPSPPPDNGARRHWPPPLVRTSEAPSAAQTHGSRDFLLEGSAQYSTVCVCTRC